MFRNQNGRAAIEAVIVTATLFAIVYGLLLGLSWVFQKTKVAEQVHYLLAQGKAKEIVVEHSRISEKDVLEFHDAINRERYTFNITAKLFVMRNVRDYYNEVKELGPGIDEEVEDEK